MDICKRPFTNCHPVWTAEFDNGSRTKFDNGNRTKLDNGSRTSMARVRVLVLLSLLVELKWNQMKCPSDLLSFLCKLLPALRAR